MTVRDLVVDLCAEHLDALGGDPASLQTLVGLLAACGVGEPSTRMATAALRRAGWLGAAAGGRGRPPGAARPRRPPAGAPAGGAAARAGDAARPDGAAAGVGDRRRRSGAAAPGPVGRAV